ncbi:IS30 family transposase [Microbacterium sp. NPDC006705]|uniref:IS30 family transposase n=1 Tax=Microbacterium sp. NPDC006705 TaxID=3364181 RepID=UPI00384C3049
MRVAFTSEQEDTVWELWGRGEPTRLIARSLRTNTSAVTRNLAKHGGVPPAARQRSRLQLTIEQREEVTRGIAAGLSSRTIAASIGRAPSTVSREPARNGGRDAYRATSADAAAWRRASRPKPSRLASDAELLRVVRDRLEADWSPEQIAHWLRRQHPTDTRMRISHETIYRSIYVAGRRELGRDAARHLRSGRSVRRARVAKRSHGRGVLRNMNSIRTRPVTVAERVELGHWEGDLVMGARPSAVATLVERSTRYVRVIPLPNEYRATQVRAAIAADLVQLPSALRRTLTWDRGREMAKHQELAADLGMGVFFCDPRSPWQRGSNENTNRLLRQYLAKSADLRRFTASDLARIADRINTRPRRVLGWATAAESFLPHLRNVSPNARRPLELSTTRGQSSVDLSAAERR